MKQVLLKSPDGARVKIFLQGAHLASWHPVACEEQLFLSKTTEFGLGKALRGGVPIIFPQFANRGTMIKHGFARTAIWTLLEHGKINDHQAQAVLQLSDSPSTQAIWPHAFLATLSITLGGTELQIELKIQNTGTTPFEFTSALHTYFAVSHIASTMVHGLTGKPYFDSAQRLIVPGDPNRAGHTQEGFVIHGEVDRIYPNIDENKDIIEIRQAHQTVFIQQKGFRDLVLWNPGQAKAAALTDLEAGGEQGFICIEAANALHVCRLAAGAIWCGVQKMKIKPD